MPPRTFLRGVSRVVETKAGGQHATRCSGYGCKPDRHGSLVLCGADEIDCEVSDDGHVSSAVASPQTGLILIEGDVEDPVQTVLDGPVTANGLGCLCG